MRGIATEGKGVFSTVRSIAIEGKHVTDNIQYAFTLYGNPPHNIIVQGIARENKCVSIIAMDMIEAKAYPALCYRHDNGQRKQHEQQTNKLEKQTQLLE